MLLAFLVDDMIHRVVIRERSKQLMRRKQPRNEQHIQIVIAEGGLSEVADIESNLEFSHKDRF